MIRNGKDSCRNGSIRSVSGTVDASHIGVTIQRIVKSSKRTDNSYWVLPVVVEGEVDIQGPKAGGAKTMTGAPHQEDERQPSANLPSAIPTTRKDHLRKDSSSDHLVDNDENA